MTMKMQKLVQCEVLYCMKSIRMFTVQKDKKTLPNAPENALRLQDAKPLLTQIKPSARIDCIQQFLPQRLLTRVPRQLQEIDTRARSREPVFVIS